MIYRRPYIESSVFIRYITDEDSQETEIVQSIFDAAERGELIIVTATWTIAEVHKRKKFGKEVLTESQSTDVLSYFRETYIDPVEIDRLVAERAHNLCREFLPNGVNPSLRPGDALHIAAAERGKCDVILSYDPDFLNLNYTGIPIESPKMVRRTEAVKQIGTEQSGLFEDGEADAAGN